MAESRVRLVIDSQEFDAKLKRAGDALNRFFDVAKKGDRTFEVVDEGVMEAVQAMGKMETASKSAKGSLAELQKAFTDMSLAYRRFTDEEKQSPVGKAMAQSLSELKTRIQDTKKDLASINQELSGSKFGQFGGIIDDIGHKIGVSANLTELLTSKTALMTTGIGAAVAVIGKATEAWASYNTELAKQDQQAQVVTGLKGDDADRMSDAARALADTYNVDFRQAIEAANTIMAQFGRSGDEAIQLLRDGLQGMVLGDGQKLLSMIQQYGPAFQSAGVSASQLVAVIQNSEGGIFTDQNMQAIVMGIKNIRLMTKQTSDALSQLGIDGNKMSEQLNNGTLTVFDALKQVAGELKGVDSNSKAAGEVMQAVFGRQGAMAGTNIAKAIEGLNTNLAETKRQTGELGAAYADLELANERLNSAIRDCFEYDGWEQMTTGIKTGLLNALSEVLELSIKIKNSWVGELGATIFDKMSTAALEATGIFGHLLNLIRGIKEEAGDTATPENVGKEGAVIARMVPERIMRPSKEASDLKNTDAGKRKDVHKQNIERYDAQIAEQKNVVKENKKWFGESSMVPAIQEVIDEEKKKLQELQDMRKSYIQKAETILNPPESKKKKDPNKPDHEKTQSAKTETQQNEAAIAKLTEEYQNLATAAKTADDAQKAGMTERMTAIQGEIKTLQERNAELKKFSDEAKGVKVAVDVPNSLPKLMQQLKDLQQAQSQSLDTREWVEYQKQIDVTTTKIDILKGKWKEGQVATFSFEEKKPDKMVFTADNKDVLTKLAEIREAVGGIEIDDKTLTVTANTAEAVDALRKIDELTIQPKEVSFLADNAEVLEKLREVDGVSIDEKTLTVTANTAEAYNKVQELIGGNEGTSVSFEVKPDITYTDANMQAFLSDLKKQVQQAELGSELYNNLTAQIADANALANLMQTAIKNGIDVTQFNPQDLWSKVFGKNPGDYITDAQWKEIEAKINEELKKMNIEPIQLNFSTGSVTSSRENKKGTSNGDELKEMNKNFSTMTHDLSSISSSLNTLGLDVPEGVNKVLSGMQAISTILTAIQSLISISNTTSGLNSIPLIGGVASLFVSLFSSFDKGGVVPHAANGYFVPGTHYSGDVTPIMANAGELVLNTSSQKSLASDILHAQSLVDSINDLYLSERPMIGADRGLDLSISNIQQNRDVNVSISSDQIKLTLRNGAQARGMTIGQYLEI